MDRPVDIDTRRLRVFLTVAQELHFRRAATLLHMSQPALSQQIRLLERDLKVELFVRTSRQVELTPAGEALKQAAPRAIYEVERAMEAARHAALGTTGRLLIGSVRTGLAQVVPKVMREFTSAHPGVRYELVHMDTTLQLRALQDRRIDIGVVRTAPPTEHLTIEPLVSEPLMVALPAEHRLAVEREVNPSDLEQEQFVSWPRHLGPDFFDIVIAFCRDHGFSPQVNTEGDDIDTQLALVAAGFGVSLQPAYYSQARPDGVVFRPLSGNPPVVVLQIARRRDCAPLVEEFAKIATSGVELTQVPLEEMRDGRFDDR